MQSSRRAVDPNYCSSAFLAYRYVPIPGVGWSKTYTPQWPDTSLLSQSTVTSATEIERHLSDSIRRSLADVHSTGILLSGGIDSAILATFLPQGTPAFTIRFAADGAVDESSQAAKYAEAAGLDLHVVEVTWDDYVQWTRPLMAHKGAPLHAVEVGLHVAARAAARQGLSRLIVGNGADSTFGGMDKLLSRDWSYDDFVQRYTFVNPEMVLQDPVPVFDEYEKYRSGSSIDVSRFLKETHGIGIVQSFDNAVHAAGLTTLAPYEEMTLGTPLDMDRIRTGEPKYLLQEVFRRRYPEIEPPNKVPFARPMDVWLHSWPGPQHPAFRDDLDINIFTGEQKWLLWTLNELLCALDEGSRS